MRYVFWKCAVTGKRVDPWGRLRVDCPNHRTGKEPEATNFHILLNKLGRSYGQYERPDIVRSLVGIVTAYFRDVDPVLAGRLGDYLAEAERICKLGFTPDSAGDLMMLDLGRYLTTRWPLLNDFFE